MSLSLLEFVGYASLGSPTSDNQAFFSEKNLDHFIYYIGIVKEGIQENVEPISKSNFAYNLYSKYKELGNKMWLELLML